MLPRARGVSPRRFAGPNSSAAEVAPDLLLGAVAIPERHTRKGDEHLRLLAKQDGRLLLLCHPGHLRRQRRQEPGLRLCLRVPRSRPRSGPDRLHLFGVRLDQDLEFLRWLGVDVPRWIENDLRHADDTLDASLELAEATAVELMSFCRRLGVPFGINVESVSIRRFEIEASVRLAERLRGELAR